MQTPRRPWKGRDHARRPIDSLRRPLCRFHRRVVGLAHEPQVAAHDPVRESESSIDRKLAAHGRNHPHLPNAAVFELLMPIAEVGDLPAKPEVGICIKQVETGRRWTSQHVLTDCRSCRVRTSARTSM